MKYFAYGSNMFSYHLRECVPSAIALGMGILRGHDLRFHKRSKDKSGKCNAFSTGNAADLVHGVIYEIEPSGKSSLGSKEGLGKGYNEEENDVEVDGETITVFTYLADSDSIDDSLKPYTWYKDFVVQGAKEHGLPKEYIEKLEAVEAIQDPDEERDKKKNQVLVKGLKINIPNDLQ